jgi:hypothetical protein
MAPGALMSHDRRVDHTDAMAFADAWVTAWIPMTSTGS